MRYSQARSFRREAVSDIDVDAMVLVIDWEANRALRQLCPPPQVKRAVWWRRPVVLPTAVAAAG